MAVFVPRGPLIQVILLLALWRPVGSVPSFTAFQRHQLNASLPKLPLQIEVYGSIFQTAYYFVDINIGAPQPQSLTMIIDTGSSTQGIPCHDCESCGNAHWDQYYNRTKSVFNQKMPCGDCATCRLANTEEMLRALAPTLMPYLDSDEFDEQAAKYLLNDASRMQCLYNVHYAEGSSLSGLFYTDVIWLNIQSKDGANGVPVAAQTDMCPAYPLSPGPSLPIVVPVGCHIEETHLFYDQKASGILGLEFWGNKGVPTFPTAALDGLKALYSSPNLTVADCDEDEGGHRTFQYAFSLCLSPHGGVMSFGGTNDHFHHKAHRIRLGTPAAQEFRVPLITNPSKVQSYLIGLKSMSIAKKNQFADSIDSMELYSSSHDASRWDPVELKPSAIVYETAEDKGIKVIPTLLDSGTTLTYLPSRLFNSVLEGISERVTINTHLRERVRAGQGVRRLNRQVSPETLFASKNSQVIVIDSFDKVPRNIPENAVEYIPMSNQPLLLGPKRLVRLNLLANSKISRSLRATILEAATEAKFEDTQRGRRLHNTPPTWYAVLEPGLSPGHSKLVGFIDIPPSMEGAPPRALVSKLDGYNNGECWWLQEQSEDLPLFPALSFEFHNGVKTVWHPESYLYSGTNDHFWCLAMMTDAMGSNNDNVDEEIIFGSNSFVHHDMVFALEDATAGNLPQKVFQTRNDKLASYGVHPNATVYIIPASCPTKDLGGRTT
eukprot:Blabericola_migrator_1__1700@NODE_1458_length_4514_cov_172_331684_g560_i1_p1_GENE_NODE_1458_length_4514_cov_172_331684_g560_i1NODE_1458_length_4514_cov_172_331684_g560_i1_p1_ORF_typecomplete_len718_score54_51TAXi_N/PF14543_6/1e24Asp/PF00026_23/5_8e19TAXi_C/PF14541_6/1_3e03TAXi_C/PF14541_6/0_012TAXi_C/PF14541_6/5_1e07gagasp_proteas/PF13975_6/17gagasp_proteas/PF13975_6/8_8e03gagasp_proteas/PF13975_6/38_NODE_1458_length_4514_cov_172_331684_g560_i1682221